MKFEMISQTLHNHLQVPGVAYHILNRLSLPLALLSSLSHRIRTGNLNLGKMYPTVFHRPAILLRKVDNCTFRVQEEKALGRGNGERRV